jgi:RNA polymerase sigma-70 factor (ECF subfamily)
MPNLQETSASLLSGLRKHDQQSLYESCWERFVDQYTPIIYRWCRNTGLNHQDTEEITQQLMCRLVRALRNYKYDQQQKFRSWLFVCTRNVIFQFWKDEAKRKTESRFDLTEVCQSQSLIEFLNESYDREFEMEARKRVQQKVGDRDWKLFLALTESSRVASQLAAEWNLTVDNVYKIKSRIVAALQLEVNRLQKMGIDS